MARGLNDAYGLLSIRSTFLGIDLILKALSLAILILVLLCEPPVSAKSRSAKAKSTPKDLVVVSDETFIDIEGAKPNEQLCQMPTNSLYGVLFKEEATNDGNHQLMVTFNTEKMRKLLKNGGPLCQALQKKIESTPMEDTLNLFVRANPKQTERLKKQLQPQTAVTEATPEKTERESLLPPTALENQNSPISTDANPVPPAAVATSAATNTSSDTNACIVGNQETMQLADQMKTLSNRNAGNSSSEATGSCENCTSIGDLVTKIDNVTEIVDPQAGPKIPQITKQCILESMKDLKDAAAIKGVTRIYCSNGQAKSLNNMPCITEQVVDYVHEVINDAIACASYPNDPVDPQLMFKIFNNESRFGFFVTSKNGAGTGQIVQVAKKEFVQPHEGYRKHILRLAGKSEDFEYKPGDLVKVTNPKCERFKDVLQKELAREKTKSNFKDCDFLSLDDGFPRNALISTLLMLHHRDTAGAGGITSATHHLQKSLCDKKGCKWNAPNLKKARDLASAFSYGREALTGMIRVVSSPKLKNLKAPEFTNLLMANSAYLRETDKSMFHILVAQGILHPTADSEFWNKTINKYRDSKKDYYQYLYETLWKKNQELDEKFEKDVEQEISAQNKKYNLATKENPKQKAIKKPNKEKIRKSMVQKDQKYMLNPKLFGNPDAKLNADQIKNNVARLRVALKGGHCVETK